MWAAYDILGIWKDYAENVHGTALDCGHFLPEEAPVRTTQESLKFLRS